ncbi:MAG: hypothetical protein GZ087_03425 [Flavobacterium sp.]|nr:hypothetical protein [Flavobacterium sp.]
MWYKVDWDRLILLLLPTFLRKPVLFGFLKALVSPIGVTNESVHYRWERFRDDNLNKLSYNGQRCYLRKVLNDRCDANLRRITIGNTAQLDQDYLYTTAENLDVYLGTMYLENDFNYVSGLVDFLVNVPKVLKDSNENKIIALLEFYKLAGKSYKIVYYE